MSTEYIDREEPGIDWFDTILVIIFLLGIYLGIEIRITHNIPFPVWPAGLSGFVLLWRRRDQIAQSHIVAFLVVVLLLLASIFSAADIRYLSKRFTGLVQLTYSLVIGYALFLTFLQARREQLASIFLGFSLAILIGCLLEDYGGLRPISDAVRLKLYSYGIYDSDLRDMLLYGRIRPKLFTSEPSAVTFAYTLYTFSWLVFSRWRWKLLVYVALLGAGLVAMPGVTLLLMLVLVVPYEMFLSGRNSLSFEGLTPARLIKIGILSAIMLAGFVYVANAVYSTRLREIANGADASFFYREIGPMLLAHDVVKHYPASGAGLTGELFISKEITNVYMSSPSFSASWQFTDPRDVVTNYFWLHWIYLGLVWGTIILVALTVWLKVLGVPSILFCWAIWTVMGQASGSYVGPKTWTVLFLAAAGAVLHTREAFRAALTGSAAESGFAFAAQLAGRRRSAR